MITRSILLTVTCIWSIGCSSERDIGDAAFTDHGADIATRRFEVDFGPVDLTKAHLQEYRVQGLPTSALTVGIEVRGPSEGWKNGPGGDAIVAIQVERDSNRLVDVHGPLRGWTWSDAKAIPTQFGYVDKDYADGRVDSQFQADPTGSFVVRLKIDPADGTIQPIDARLKAYGGGWK